MLEEFDNAVAASRCCDQLDEVMRMVIRIVNVDPVQNDLLLRW